MIDTTNWKPFFLSEIFKIQNGNKFDLNKMTEKPDSKISFVSRTAKNNGVSIFVEEVEDVTPYPAGSLTVALGGSIGSTFIQITPFYTGQNVAVLSPKIELSIFSKIFISVLINLETDMRYIAFGRELNSHINTDFTINLPVQNPEPYACDIKTRKELFIFDSEVIKNYSNKIYNKIKLPIMETKSSLFPMLTEVQKQLQQLPSSKMVRLDEIFEVRNGIPSKKVTRQSYKSPEYPIPYIRPSKSQFSSIDQYINPIIDNVTNYLYPKGTLYVSTNGEGSHTYSYVSVESFVPNSDVSVLIPKEELSLESKLFYATIITYNRFRFSYGRKPKGEDLASMKIPKFSEI